MIAGSSSILLKYIWTKSCSWAALLKFWFQTDLGRENSTGFYMQGGRSLLTFLTIVTNRDLSYCILESRVTVTVNHASLAIKRLLLLSVFTTLEPPYWMFSRISEVGSNRKLVPSTPRLSFWTVWFRHNPIDRFISLFHNVGTLWKSRHNAIERNVNEMAE